MKPDQQSSLLEISVDRSKNQLASSAEFREVDFLNQVSDAHAVLTTGPVFDRDRDMIAIVNAVAYSGPSSADFPGTCATGFVPFTKEEASSLDDCWAKCRSSPSCTQVQFSDIAETCYLAHGISVRAQLSASPENEAMPSSVCRSLTAAGVTALNGGSLPAFRELPNNRVVLSSSASLRPMLVDSLAECQAACLDSHACHFGVWLTKADGNNDCVIASAVSTACLPGAAECEEMCGSEDCILFERNLLNLASPVQLTHIPAVHLSAAAFGKNLTESQSCELKCGSPVASESVCTTLCLVEARQQCQVACIKSKCTAAGFFYGGNRTVQTCVSFSSVPVLNETFSTEPVDFSDSSLRLVDVFVVPGGAVGSLSLIQNKRSMASIARLSKFLSPSDVRPKFAQFGGPCNVFHEGVLGGSGPGVSRFRADSMDDCWHLCETLSGNQCSQAQFHSGSSECVLGDAIASTFRADDSITCRTLQYTAVSTSHGLSGMLFVDSVGDMGRDTTRWFGGATAPTLVDSLEECQALCKMADAGATDAVCRFGGFVECSSFHSTLCRGTGAAHPDCGLCDRNPSGGVCRIPKVPVSGAPAQAETPIPCLGGRCRWFERSAIGYALTTATAVVPAVNMLPMTPSGVICSSESYLPNAQKPSTDDCFYPVESLWHCEELCSIVNRMVGQGKTACVGGLYKDKGGNKQCRLAKFRVAGGRPCDAKDNCAWFELSGEGHTAGLELTGAVIVEESRKRAVLPFIIGVGPCQQFRALDAVITNTPKGFQYSPLEDCANACNYFPQCSSYQLTGSVSGGSGQTCDVLKGADSDCTFITCTLSSAISVASPADNNAALCWSKTPSGTVEEGPAAVDMEVDPGMPGYYTTNARVRKFSWDKVLNKEQLALTTTLEECQSLCRVSDGCVIGSWQHCKSIEQYCGDAAGAPAEVQATCNACKDVKMNEAQVSVQFPEIMGVCKMASEVSVNTEGCFPEPCYAFEEGSENFYMLSTTKSPLIMADGRIDELRVSLKGEPRAYTKTRTIGECEEHCMADADCKYGHFVPRTNGYGECYLTSQELRISDGYTYQLKDPRPCEGTCVVFMKLPTKLPSSLFAPAAKMQTVPKTPAPGVTY